MSKDQQTASQFAGTEEGAPADVFTPLATTTDPLHPLHTRKPSQAAPSGQRKQVGNGSQRRMSGVWR
jgi:hypothetical protein